MKAFWLPSSTVILLGIVAFAAAQGPEASSVAATGARDSYESLAAEMAALRLRIDDLERERGFVDTQFIAADHTDFVGFEAATVFGRLSIQGEYVRSSVQNAIVGTRTADADADGYYVMASYFLTGEHRPYTRSNGGFGRIKPRKTIRPAMA